MIQPTIRFHLIALCLLLVSIANASDIRVIALTCNYQKNPLAVSEIPLLSWKLVALKRGQKQTAYQILVASSPALLEEKLADVWNSGKVNTAQSVHITFNGKTLETRKQYYWKVRVWDVNGNASNFSEINFWQMAILNQDDWKAKWISAPVIFDFEKLNQYRYSMIGNTKADFTEPLPILRKEFSISKNIRTARLYVAAPGYYEFFLNGEKVGNQILDPAFTNFDKTVLYAVHDVTPILKNGANTAGVMLGNGWYNSETKEVWGFDKAPWRNLPTLKCQIEVNYDDNSKEIIVSDETWLAHPGPITFSSVRQGEYYNARLEIAGWNESNLDTKKWQGVRIVGGPIGKLKPQTLPPVKITEVLKPIKSFKLSNGNTVFDFGQNIAGFARIEVTGEAGSHIQLVYSEKIKADGSADQSGINNLNVDFPFQTDRYILKGSNLESWSPRFTYHGFRYIEVSASTQVDLKKIEACAIQTSFTNNGSFSCSNELINSIQKSTEWSFRNNFVGIPTDCPQREKNGWTGDAQLACETGLTNFAPITSYQKWLNDIEDEQQANGSLPGIIPTAGWGYYWGNGPAWDIACVVIPYSMYQYTSDTLVLKRYYSMMKKYVDYMHTRSENLIANFGLGDWVPVKTETPADVTSTGYFYYGANTLAKVASILGHQKDHLTYSNLASSIKEAFNKKYFDQKNHRYANGSQTALSCALFHGLVEEKWRKDVVKNLVHEVTQKDNHIDCGILGARYILHVLRENDQVDLAFKMISQESYPGWGYMIRNGATTLWEDWKGEASLNHIMLGDVSAWFYKTLAGIQLDSSHTGFKHFYIKPSIVGNLTWANGTYESVYGTIVSNWKKEGNTFIHKIHVPVNTSATLLLPAKDISTIKESKKSLAKAEGVKIAGTENGYVKILLTAGVYDFTSQLK